MDCKPSAERAATRPANNPTKTIWNTMLSGVEGIDKRTPKRLLRVISYTRQTTGRLLLNRNGNTTEIIGIKNKSGKKNSETTVLYTD